MDKYYEVVAKCGHVGKKFYYRGVFYFQAEDGRTAAKMVRTFPRVKHDHPDAILNVLRITKEEYLDGCKRSEGELYFKCENIQEQSLYWQDICANIFLEDRYIETEKQKPRRRRRRKEVPFRWRNYCWDDVM